ncbi:MAG: hypothetical protein WA745_05170, partial [Methylovirgula sp.]
MRNDFRSKLQVQAVLQQNQPPRPRLWLSHEDFVLRNQSTFKPFERYSDRLLGRNPHEARQLNLTVKAAVEEYIKGAVDLRPRTIRGYRDHLDRYLDPTPEIRRRMEKAKRKIDWTI